MGGGREGGQRKERGGMKEGEEGAKGGGSLQLMATHSGGYRMVPTAFGLEYSIKTS